MYKYIILLVSVLSGCSTLSDKNPDMYAESFEQAKIILKSNNALKRFKKYYNAPNHKALAQSKINGAGAFATNNTSEKHAIESALAICQQRLLKKFEKITDEVSCEIVNVNNVWVGNS